MATKAEKTVEVKTPKIKTSSAKGGLSTKKVSVKKVEVKEPKVAKAKAEKKVVKELENSKTQELKTVKVKAIKKESTIEEVEVVEVQVSETPVEVVEEVKAEPKKVVKVFTGSTSAEELFEAGAHFGHIVKKWNPKMNKFLWGAKNGIHIFDLEKTMLGINEAVKALTELAASGKRIVLVGTKRQVRQMVEEEAKRLGTPFITQRWIGGLITNWKQVKQTVDRLNSQKTKRDAGQLKKYTKKEQVLFDKEIARLERIVGGISTLKEAPEVVVVFDTHKEKLAVKEASSRGVSVVGIVDSNANPDKVDFVIPMNDDSAKGLEIMVKVLGQAIETGLKLKESKAQNVSK